MIAIVPLFAAIVGLLVYVLASSAKVAEVGRALMWCGILITLWTMAGHSVKIL